MANTDGLFGASAGEFTRHIYTYRVPRVDTVDAKPILTISTPDPCI